MTEPIVIGLGGNLGDDAEIIERFRRARDAIAELGEVRSAPLYRSAPIGPAQPAYLNTALRLVMPDAIPGELMAALLEIERLLGRVRDARWGPRVIDLDVLVWGARVIESPELVVPHRELARRRFALEPLVALTGDDFEVPGVGRAGELLARVRDQQVEQIAETW